MRARPAAEAALAVGALCGLTALVFLPALGADQAFLERDMLRVYLPAKLAWADAVRAGAWPGWYPYDAFGQALAGLVVSGAYSPWNVLWLLFEPVTALKVAVLSSYPLAGLGAWLCFRGRGASMAASALGAAAWMLCGPLLSTANNLPYLQSTAALAWVFWAHDRAQELRSWAWAAGAGVALSWSLLSGDPQGLVVGGALLGVLALARTRGPGRAHTLALLAVTATVAALLSAPQWLAALAAQAEGWDQARTLEGALLWSMHPWRLLELALGPVFSDTGPHSAALAAGLMQAGVADYWSRSVAVGAPVLLLAATGLALPATRRAALAPALAALVLLLLALGRHLPFYALLHRLPVWSAFRYPEKLAPQLAFLLVALAVPAADALGRAGPAVLRRWRVVPLGAASVCLLIAGLAGPLADALAPPGAVSALALTLRAGGLAGAAACVALAVLHWGRLPTSSAAWGTAALAAAHALWASAPAWTPVPRAVVEAGTPIVQALARQAGEGPEGRWRVFQDLRQPFVPQPELRREQAEAVFAATALLPDAAAHLGVEAAGWYLPGITARSARYLSDRRLFGERLASLANVRFVAVDAARVPPGAPAAFRTGPVAFLENPSARPRAWFASPRCVRGPEESLRALAEPTFDGARQVVVECDESAGAADAHGRVLKLDWGPQRVEAEVDVERPGALVLADAYARGWSATVDGAPAPLWPANHAFRAVPVGPGLHRVAFRYRPPEWPLGPALAAAGALACALGVLADRLRHRRATPA